MPNANPPSHAHFSLRGLSFAVPGRTLLHPLDFSFPPGQVCGLIGHNGSGKSTLLKILGRHQPASNGEARLNDQPLAAWESKAFARQVAYLPQQLPAAEGMTVRELVALGRYPWHGALGRFSVADREHVHQAIELVGLEGLADRLVDSLSGGERQRAWLAMTMAQDSRCLLLDEPTSALDIAHQVEVLALVQRLSRQRGLTVIAVLHDINMAARYCDHLAALRGGRLIAEGPPSALMCGEVLERIYGIPMGILPHPAPSRRRRAGKLCLLMARLLAPPDLPRRRLLSAMMLAPLLARQALAAPQPEAPRVVAVEWLPAELLFALGITPIAVADMVSYRQWVQQPVLPPEVIDVGERTSPNLELLAELQPDLILYSAGYGPRAEQLKAVAPAMGFAYTDAAGKPLDMARVSIMALAQRLNREALGRAHLAWFDRQLAQAAPTLASYRRQPLLVFSVMDERHALVVGRNHLFQQVLDQLGIDNLWQGETNFWGTAVVGIEKLIELPPGRAILLEQDDGALRQRISKTPLWQAIPFVRQQSWHPAPAIWFYGATLAALRFCRLLERLEGEWS